MAFRVIKHRRNIMGTLRNEKKQFNLGPAIVNICCFDVVGLLDKKMNYSSLLYRFYSHFGSERSSGNAKVSFVHLSVYPSSSQPCDLNTMKYIHLRFTCVLRSWICSWSLTLGVTQSEPKIFCRVQSNTEKILGIL